MNGRRVAAGVLTLGGVGILCALGTWQLQRLAWKNDIIARLETARAHPRTFTFADLETLGHEHLPLAFGTVSGRLLSANDILVGPKPADDGTGAIGYHLVTPLKLSGGTVLVDRGWVLEDFKDPAQRAHLTAPASVMVSFTGIVRKADWNRFTSGNNPANDLWFRTDTAQIAAAKHLGRTAPVVMYAETANRKFDAQAMNPPGWAPRNKHLQYALFWYSMAGVLAGFYLFLFLRHKKTA
jgi:surfeit locus 1 family protein